MILTNEQVVELIKNPKNSEKIKEGIRLNKASRTHFTGEDFLSLIVQLVGWETAKEYDAKKGLADPVTMKQTEFIYRELTRWQNNPEIKMFYDFGNDNNGKRIFENTISKIHYSDKLEKFRNETLSKSKFYNFNSFIMLEKPAKIEGDSEHVIINGIVTSAKNAPKYYITLLDISCVHDFQKSGNDLEYIIYCNGTVKEGVNIYKKFRCIDSTLDRIYIQRGESITLSDEKVFYHEEIPVKQIGNDFKHVHCTEVTISPINQVIPLMDRFIKFDAINLISETKGAYPKNWAYGSECEKCAGSGKIPSSVPGETDITCPECKGHKYIDPYGNGETMLIPPTHSEGQKAFTNTPAGIIQNDVAILTYQSDKLSYRDLEIIKSALGEHIKVQQSADKSATEIVVNLKPLEDRNRIIAESVEYTENWICNYIGRNISKDFKGYNVIIPKKLNVLDENSITKQIKEAKELGLSAGHIKELAKQLIYSVYRNDSAMLKRQLVLLELEPMPCYSIAEIKDLKFVTENDKIIKQYFVEIISSLELKYGDIVNYYNANKRDVILSEIKLMAESMIEKKKPLLVDSLGVGGTQSLKEIMSDMNMLEERKKGLLKVVFGISDEDIEIIFKKENTN